MTDLTRSLLTVLLVVVAGVADGVCEIQFVEFPFKPGKYTLIEGVPSTLQMHTSFSFVKLRADVAGVCIPSLKHNASKFKVQHLLFDRFLKKHYRHSIEIFARDPNKICKTGDIALIQELPQSMTQSIKHQVLQVVYTFGDLTDPITGKKCTSGMSRDDMEVINTMYGKINANFDYYNAPSRGWQEDKRDFSHRESYWRYHEFEDNDENKDQPYSLHT